MAIMVDELRAQVAESGEGVETQWGIADQRFMDVLPLVCPFCDSELMMNDGFTQLRCKNVYCPSKVTQRLVAICQDLGVKFLGESAALKLVQDFELAYPLAVFEMLPQVPHTFLPAQDQYLTSPVVQEKVVSQLQQVHTRVMTLPELVRLHHIPGIQTQAYALFEGFTSMSQAYDFYVREGIAGVQKRLTGACAEGEVSTVGVRAVQIFDTLMQFRSELLYGEQIFTVAQQSLPSMTVVVSDAAGAPFVSKPQFYAALEEVFAGRVSFIKGNAVTKAKTDVLVWAGSVGEMQRVTSKVKKAHTYNSSGSQIPVVSGVELLVWLREQYGVAEVQDSWAEFSWFPVVADPVDVVQCDSGELVLRKDVRALSLWDFAVKLRSGVWRLVKYTNGNEPFGMGDAVGVSQVSSEDDLIPKSGLGLFE